MQHYKRRLSPSILLAGALLMLACSWALASSASAAVPGVVNAPQGVSAFNSQAEKRAEAFCPPGTNVVGAGATITGANGEIVLTSVAPQSNLRSVVAEAREDQDGSSRNWRVNAQAKCAPPIAGMHLVSDDNNISNSQNHSATARCNPGEQVLGTGATITSFGGGGQIKLDQINPSTSSVFAFAREDRDGFSGNWSIDALAICANPVGQTIKRAVAFGSSPQVNASARCASGTRVLGGGFDSTVQGSGGEAVIDAFLVSGTSVGAQSRPDQAGLALSRAVEAVAICG